MDEYLNQLHTDAMRISGLIEGALILDNEGTKEATHAVGDILAVAAPMLTKLYTDLDSVNRPEAIK